MEKEITKDGWLYEYEETAKYRINNYEVTGVRYVLGEQFDTSCRKTLICIGINPSTAVPGDKGLDNTVRNVQKYAKNSGEYGAWYMLNVYPQRATNPDDMDIEPDMEIHRNNLTAIKNLLSEIKEADVWCAWGNTIGKRKYLYDLLFGNKEKGIDGIISLFNTNYHFKAYGSTVKGCPKHPLVMSNNDKLKDLAEVGLIELNNNINKTTGK